MSWKALLGILLFLWGVGSGVSVFTNLVELDQGRLRGRRSLLGQNQYYGIPYATSKRFQPPEAPPRWEGIFNAILPFGSCAQSVSILTLGDEDCLNLDVYTPGLASIGDRLPVLVFLHGGGYYYGSKIHYDPEFIVNKNVIVVIINYRVGVLGFLCVNGIANLGLKDQVAALKWIKKNIAAFGGDPDNVTISGQSAGATSASMHILAEASKDLFHKAFLLSGAPLTPWAFNIEPLTPALEDANKITLARTEEDIFNVFNSASIQSVLSSTHDVSTNPRYFKYSPCVDSNTTDPLFRDTPYNILKSGNFNKVPVLLGFTDIEGLLFYGINTGKSLRELNEKFVDKLPSVFSWCSSRDRKKIAKKIHSHYFGKKPIWSRVKGIIDYYSDWIAYSTIDEFAKLMAERSDKAVYSYLFAYEGDRNFAKFALGSTLGVKGASHSDDIFYFFKPLGISAALSSRDKVFIDRITTMLTNFMKYGNPTPKPTKLLPISWPARSANSSKYMRLDHQLSVVDLPKRQQGDFLRGLLCTYGQQGYVPCVSRQECRPDHKDKR